MIILLLQFLSIGGSSKSIATARNSEHKTQQMRDANLTQSPPTTAPVEESCLVKGYKDIY